MPLYLVPLHKLMRMLNIILFGPPGAGKGTQSKKLIDKYHLTHLSTGDIFRYNIQSNTELGKLAKSYMDQGILVPDEVTINMLKQEVHKHKNTAGFIFDGFPRTENQALALDQFLAQEGMPISALISLEVEETELKARLKERALTSGRPDDANPEVIEKRIGVYKNETLPVKQHYSAQNKLTTINGIGQIEEVFERLCEVLDTVSV